MAFILIVLSSVILKRPVYSEGRIELPYSTRCRYYKCKCIM